VEGGADPDLRDGGVDGWTPLLHAVHKNRNAAVRALIAAGADVDGATVAGFTPLMMAAAYGNTETVDLLLDEGANPRRRTRAGNTALSLAVRGVPDIDRFTLGSCQTRTVRALFEHAPGLELPDGPRGSQALRMARIFGCSEIVGLLERPDA
jgi:hypothetical protein